MQWRTEKKIEQEKGRLEFKLHFTMLNKMIMVGLNKMAQGKDFKKEVRN